ncbi:MFS transporter (plasmid) [Lyngbya confervoides BDU141951]|uniref:MFS transporter n=2 Tax=Lyngbya TaxID=28073 RepID=A0ABD4T782_9CYAN|nr:MFS transporter [Lyngbya confervoides BDU141951]
MGSKLAEFALAIWAYQSMDSVTQIATLVILMYLPNIVITPLTGSLIDRWNRRWTMLISDCLGATCSLVALLLVWFGQLQLWHIYIGVPILAISQALATPAYSAAIAQLVPNQHYGRANGMTDIPLAVSRILTPLLAVILLELIQLQGLLLIDVFSFGVSLFTLLSVRFPKLHQKSQPSPGIGLKQLLRESKQSWQFIRAKQGLFQLWKYIIWTYFTIGMFDLAFWLLVLKLGSAPRFGLLVSAAGCGYLIGSLAMSVWGGTKHRIFQILMLTGLQGGVVVLLGIGVQKSWMLAGLGVSLYLFADPIIMGSSKAIWQEQVPQALQGRVFSLQLMFQRGAMILAYAITGLMIDQFFDPLLASLAGTYLLRNHATNPMGAGISVFLLFLGVIKIAAAILASRNRQLINLNSDQSLAHQAASIH